MARGRQSGTANPAYRHGHSARGFRTREYSIWAGMKTRCSNKNQHAWDRYGGRGITVCERWANSFEAFLADMGPCPSDKHSIDRIDNDSGYKPDNCRWATSLEQVINSRSAKLVTVQGRRVHLKEAARILGVDRTLFTKRVASGLTPQEAVDKPINQNRSNGVRAGWARKNA